MARPRGDGLSSQGPHKDLHSSSEPQDKMESGLLLDVVVGQSPSVLELFTGEDQPLLIWRDAFLILNLGLNVLDGVRRLHFKGDGFTSQCLHEDLHSSTKPKDKMESGLLLDVVVGQSPSILKLFTSEDQSLLIRRDALLVLDLGLHILNGIGRLNLEGDGFTGQCLHEDLHTSSQSQDKMKSRLLLDVVVS